MKVTSVSDVEPGSVKFVPQFLPWNHAEFEWVGFTDLPTDSAGGESTAAGAAAVIAKLARGWDDVGESQLRYRPKGYRIIRRVVTESLVMEFEPDGSEKTSEAGMVPRVMSITLVSVRDGDPWVPGFGAGKVKDAFFMHDATVRKWIAERHEENGDVIIADDEWVNEGGFRSLTLPAEPRDLAMVAAVRNRAGRRE
jgi:hypothetical protein